VEAIGGELQPPIDHHDVGWLEMAMQEIPAVKPGKRLHNCVEHFPGLPGHKGTLAKNLGENLFGIFRDDIEQIYAVNVTASGMKKTH
jgi:hypothetical protein